MKRYIAAIFAFAMSLSAIAQTTQQEYFEKYVRLTSRLGYAGVGIETYIDKWETAFPEDGKMLEARCNYFLTKAMTTEVVPMERAKYLGEKPILSIPDSTGKTLNYFEETFFDDELFGKALGFIDQAIKLYPYDLMYRADKISVLLAYEKEYPGMSLDEMLKLTSMEEKQHPEWLIDGQPAVEGDFSQVMSGYCVRLYNIGSPEGYEAFYTLSSKLSQLYPKESNYIDNIGSYWLVCKNNDKKAMKFYKKALKMNPDDTVAKRNIQLIERRRQQAKKK